MPDEKEGKAIFNFKKQEDYGVRSLPKSVMVCGVEIKKMPLGAYVAAINLLQDAPFDILEACFPGEDIDSVLQQIKTMELDVLKKAAKGIFGTVPEYFVQLMSKLTGIEEKRLLEDDEIGLCGLAEIVEAFVKVNRLGKFMALMAKIRMQPEKTLSGSKK